MKHDLQQVIESGIRELGLPQERVEHLVSQMITYLDLNVSDMDSVSAEDFYNWLLEQDDQVLSIQENEEL